MKSWVRELEFVKTVWSNWRARASRQWGEGGRSAEGVWVDISVVGKGAPGRSVELRREWSGEAYDDNKSCRADQSGAGVEELPPKLIAISRKRQTIEGRTWRGLEWTRLFAYWICLLRPGPQIVSHFFIRVVCLPEILFDHAGAHGINVYLTQVCL